MCRIQVPHSKLFMVTLNVRSPDFSPLNQLSANRDNNILTLASLRHHPLQGNNFFSSHFLSSKFNVLSIHGVLHFIRAQIALLTAYEFFFFIIAHVFFSLAHTAELLLSLLLFLHIGRGGGLSWSYYYFELWDSCSLYL